MTLMSPSGPKRHLVRCKDMSGVEVKADSKANAEFGRDRPNSDVAALPANGDNTSTHLAAERTLALAPRRTDRGRLLLDCVR
jgi:hypothetical protein